MAGLKNRVFIGGRRGRKSNTGHTGGLNGRITGCSVDDVDGGEPVPKKFVIRYLFSQPAFDQRRSDQYDYWLTYELENGVWHFVYIEENPLTMDVINKAVADDLARLIEIYEKTD